MTRAADDDEIDLVPTGPHPIHIPSLSRSADPSVPLVFRPVSPLRRLVSFDGQTSATAPYLRADRYRSLEVDLGDRPRIARGGGYSYVAASFGRDVVVQDLRDLDRVLEIDEAGGRIVVEAGTTLRQLYGILGARRSWLPVQPGYPEVTVGGCIAANVNAKNSRVAGTFVRSVERLTLLHPSRGRIDVDRSCDPTLFELTCGGFGLTGTIVSATLRFEQLPADTVRVRRIAVGSLAEAVTELLGVSQREAFAYSWHDPSLLGRRFGRGIVNVGRAGDEPSRRAAPPRYPVITSGGRAWLPFGLWNRTTIALANEAIWRIESAHARETVEDLFAFLFPFATNPYYFLFFGAPGFLETQLLVPTHDAPAFLGEVERQARRLGAPITLLSLKLLSGERTLLRFEGDGVCLSMDVVRSPEGLAFLSVLDEMIVAAKGIPNLIKDSRLPRAVVESCYSDVERFRAELRRSDPHRLCRSALSVRLGL